MLATSVRRNFDEIFLSFLSDSTTIQLKDMQYRLFKSTNDDSTFSVLLDPVKESVQFSEESATKFMVCEEFMPHAHDIVPAFTSLCPRAKMIGGWWNTLYYHEYASLQEIWVGDVRYRAVQNRKLRIHFIGFPCELYDKCKQPIRDRLGFIFCFCFSKSSLPVPEDYADIFLTMAEPKNDDDLGETEPDRKHITIYNHSLDTLDDTVVYEVGHALDLQHPFNDDMCRKDRTKCKANGVSVMDYIGKGRPFSRKELAFLALGPSKSVMPGTPFVEDKCLYDNVNYPTIDEFLW